MAKPSTLGSRLDKKPIKVNKLNMSEVRLSLDDILAKYMVEEALFTEDHSVINVKLLYTFILTVIGLITTFYALTRPFQQIKLILAVGAGSYLVLLGAYTYWLTFLQVATCFRGKSQASKKVVWLKSRIDPKTAEYHLAVVDPRDGGKVEKVEVKWCVGRWIRENGEIVATNFCQDLSRFISSDLFKSYLRAE